MFGHLVGCPMQCERFLNNCKNKLVVIYLVYIRGSVQLNYNKMYFLVVLYLKVSKYLIWNN